MVGVAEESSKLSSRRFPSSFKRTAEWLVVINMGLGQLLSHHSFFAILDIVRNY